MSNWTHSVCDDCFDTEYPDRQPTRINIAHRELEVCCLCSVHHMSGIYIRKDPSETLCNGHED